MAVYFLRSKHVSRGKGSRAMRAAGVWPDPSRIDKATRHHDGAGDFPVWLEENRRAPRPTLFIKGNHEDFVWLDSRPGEEVLPGLSYLRNGCTVHIQDEDAGGICVGAVGGCYGPSDYRRRSDRLQGYAKRHYTLDEIERFELVRRGHHADTRCTSRCPFRTAPSRDRLRERSCRTGYASRKGSAACLLLWSSSHPSRRRS